LDVAERRFANLGPLGTDIKVVKKQIGELKNFKSDIDPQMVKVEALNRYKHIYCAFVSIFEYLPNNSYYFMLLSTPLTMDFLFSLIEVSLGNRYKLFLLNRI